MEPQIHESQCEDGDFPFTLRGPGRNNERVANEFTNKEYEEDGSLFSLPEVFLSLYAIHEFPNIMRIHSVLFIGRRLLVDW